METYRNVGFLLLMKLVATAVQAGTSLTPTVHSFLSDNVYQQNSTRPNPVDLGQFPYECVGNVLLCPNGFTLSLWYRPDYGQLQNPALYVLSSGAQSALSPSGVYLRQNYGAEYELAVAVSGTIYTVKFNLLVAGSWTNVAATFSTTSGLVVYVDGQLVGRDNIGSSRVYAASPYNPFQEIFVGQQNDISLSTSGPGVAVWNVTHVNTVMADGDVDQFTTDVVNAMFIGCSTAFSAPTGIANTAAGQSLAQCRDVCHLSKLNIAIFQQNKGCVCMDYTSWSAVSAGWLMTGSPLACSGSEKFQVAWSSHINYVPVPPAINLIVTVKYPDANKPSVRPYETVTFQLSTNTLESVVYLVDFGDGSSLLKTTDTLIGYAWSDSGQHTVNVTAVTRSNKQTQLQTISVDGTPKGNSPTGVIVESSWDQLNDFGVIAFFQAYSDTPYVCTVSTGDQSPSDVLPATNGGNVLSLNRSHIYPGLGLYHVTLSCENQFDQTSSTETAVSIQTGVPYESHALGTDVTIAINGASGATVQAFVDGSSTPVSNPAFNNTHLVLPASLFPTPGEHSVVVSSVAPSAYNLLNKVYDVLTPVSGVTLKTSAAGVLVNQAVQLTLTILQGDQVFVEFDFGDSQTQLVYVASSPATVTASHAYSSLGQRTVTVTVANDVSSAVATALASVERPVVNVTMTTTNVTSLGQPTTFTFNVDPSISPAMPITVVFDFDDGNEQTVTLGTMQNNNAPYVFTYIYQQYGIYRVSANVGNNVSMNALPIAIVQVGENITAVDLYVDKPLVQVDQYVTVTIQCPTGSPVALTVNMGDGLPPVVLNHPDSYQPLTQDRTYPTPAPTVASTTPAASTTTGAKGSRRRRQASASSSTTSSNVNAPFVVTYKYTKPGRYTVTATAVNSLSSATSSLCPRIVVVSPPSTAPKCQPLTRITNSSTLAAPSVYQRSTVISIAATAELQCTPTSAQHQPLFTWTVDRLVGANQWRPELSVCMEASSNPMLTIRSNTLWYGTYRVNVSVSVKSSVAANDPVSTDLSSPATTYLFITPSPLVASVISEGGQTSFGSNESPALNLSMSHDPDVDFDNSTGIHRYLFCYPQASTAQYSSASINQLLEQATCIANNSDLNAGIYQFSAAPCFTRTEHTWMLGFEAVISASNLITADKLVFMAVITKDTRSARASIIIQAYPALINASALDNIDLQNPGQALSIITVVTNGMGDDQDPEAVAERMKLRTKLLNCLDKVSTRLQNVDQISLATNAVTMVTANPDEVTPNAKATAATAISSTANMATTLAANASESTVAGITQGMLTGVGQILPVDPDPDTSNVTTAAPTTTTTTTTTTTPSPPLTQPKRRYGRQANAAGSTALTTVDPSLASENETTPELTCCESIAVGLCNWIEPEGFMCVDESDRKKSTWSDYDCDMIYPDDMKTFTDRYMAWQDEQRRLANEIKKKITTNGMGAFGTIGGVLLGKQGEGAGKTVNSPSINMTVMKTAPGQGGGGDGFSVPTDLPDMGGLMHVQSKNPYTYSNDPTNPQVSGNVQTLSLVDANGNPLPVSNSSTPFVIEMNGSPTPPVPVHYIVKSGNITYNKVEIKSNFSAVMAVITPSDPTVVLAVYLKYANYSNETYYDWYTLIPNKAAADSSQQFLFYPPQELTSLNGTYFLGVTVNGTTTGAAPAANYTYSIYTYAAACLYWNETTDVWDSAGCSVSPKTTPQKTICLCTHLTSFGSNAFVAPNTIDFNTVFTAEKFLESIPVFVTVIVMIALWVVICIWARHMDKKDVAKWGAVPLEDNVPVDTYFYQLSVYTGLRRNAGTNSRPSFILSGDDGDTGVRVLYDGKRKEHTAGSIHNYILGVEDNLGPLNFLRIWHDNSGNGKKRGWFLDQVHVQDLQTGEKFYFVCNRWMAVEEDDGQIERILPVAGIDDLTQFSGMFTSSVRKKFSNDHMWASIFSRPTKSNFTRVQRVSACVALLFLTMITSCMFFKAVDTDHTTELHIGPITITPQQIMVSIQSTLIVFPPSIAIVTIFRKVRPRSNAVQSEKSSTSSSGWRSHSSGGESDLWQSAEKKSRSEKMRDAIKKITTFHQDKNKSKYEDDGTAKKKKKKPLMFPWWTIFIAWALVLLSIFLSGFFTILYSMQWGHTKSIDWLQTFLLSFAQNVIIVQPAKIFVLAMVLSLVFKKPPQTEEEEATCDNELKPDEEHLTGNVSRSQADIQEILKRRRASHINDKSIANRPDPEQLAAEREARLKQIQMDGIIRECIIYIIFVLVVYFISYQDRDHRSYQFVQNIQNTFTGGDVPFNSITTYADVNGWINKTLLPNLYSNGWYNGESPKTWHDTQQMNDHVTIRLGIGRLRQLRIKEGSCKISKYMQGIINHCRNDYNFIDEDDGDYGLNWSPVEEQNETCRAYERPFDPWRYRSTFELKGTPYLGQTTTYQGSGYCFNFRRDYHATQTKFDELAQTDWLDARTRALFIEFTLYNGNANLFGSVVMLIEFLANGGPVMTSDVKVFRLSSYEGGAGIIVVAVQIIYVLFIVYFLYNIIVSIKKQKKAYFASFWNVLEFITTILSIISIAMYAMKIILGNTAMDVLNEAGTGKYVNFVSIAVWAQMYCYLLAFIVFITTIKFLNMLRFNRRMGILTATIRVAAKDMVSFLITFLIILLAFAQWSYLLFGTQLVTYYTFTATLQSLFRFFVGQFEFTDYVQAQPALGPVFFFLYVLIGFMGLQAMFITIIVEAFQKVRTDPKMQQNDYEVVDYILQKFKGVLSMITGDRTPEATLRTSNQRGRQTDTPPVEGGRINPAFEGARTKHEVGETNVQIMFESADD